MRTKHTVAVLVCRTCPKMTTVSVLVALLYLAPKTLFRCSLLSCFSGSYTFASAKQKFSTEVEFVPDFGSHARLRQRKVQPGFVPASVHTCTTSSEGIGLTLPSTASSVFCVTVSAANGAHPSFASNTAHCYAARNASGSYRSFPVHASAQRNAASSAGGRFISTPWRQPPETRPNWRPLWRARPWHPRPTSTWT